MVIFSFPLVLISSVRITLSNIEESEGRARRGGRAVVVNVAVVVHIVEVRTVISRTQPPVVRSTSKLQLLQNITDYIGQRYLLRIWKIFVVLPIALFNTA